MRTQHVSQGKTGPIPKALRVFAWSQRGPLTAFAKKQIALNVIERGRAGHWTKLPRGWFDLDVCLTHGQKKTKQALRELVPQFHHRLRIIGRGSPPNRLWSLEK